MLHINETKRLIDNIKKAGGEIYGLAISNSVDKYYGRIYARTDLNFVTNVSLWPSDNYISYQIDDLHNIKENQDQCNEVFEEQKRDIAKLIDNIHSVYPNAEICVILSPYFYWDYSSCIITGEIEYSNIPNIITNDELKEEYKNILDYLNKRKEHYKVIFKVARKYNRIK